MNPTTAPAAIDAADLRRLRWRARRGLLENDLIIGRFFDKYAQQLSAAQWTALQQLLELDDNPLLDLLLGQAEPDPARHDPNQLQVLQMLRNC